MDQQEARYRLAAAECLERAARVKDPNTRVGLLVIAQKWLDMASLGTNEGGSWPQRLRTWLKEPSDPQAGKT
jgi:hypothetical protein